MSHKRATQAAVRASRFAARWFTGASAWVVLTTGCNLLLGTSPPVGGDAGGGDGSFVDAGEAAQAQETGAADAGADATVDATGLDASLDSATDTSLVCPDSCPRGGCTLPSCAVRLIGGLGRTMNAFADPGASGSVFFSDYDSATIYRYEKGTGGVATYPALARPANMIANANQVFWNGFASGIGWLSRSGSATTEMVDTSFHVLWNTPGRLALDTGFLYWADTAGADIWRIDLGLSAPQLLYQEVTDGGTPPEQLTTTVAVDSDPNGSVFFVARGSVHRMGKDGTGLIAFAPVGLQVVVAFHAGYVYWLDASGAVLRAREEDVASCDAGDCGHVVVPAGLPAFYGPLAFDDQYVYWLWVSGEFTPSRIGRARLDGSSKGFELVAEHTVISSIAVDDVAVYYTTASDDGKDNTGSLWRLPK